MPTAAMSRQPSFAAIACNDTAVTIAATTAFIPAAPHHSWLPHRSTTRQLTNRAAPLRRRDDSSAPARSQRYRTRVHHFPSATPRATAATPAPPPSESDGEGDGEVDDSTPGSADGAAASSSESATPPPPNPDAFAAAQATVTATINTAFESLFSPVRAACPVLSSDWTASFGNYILHPPAASAAGTAPKAVLHFVGGAFFGAVPHQLYNTLLRRLAARGHVVVATPYDLSFDYLPVADTIARRWEAVEADLAARYGPLPVVGVGHSAGAMLHALTASLFDDAAPKAANILISYNCRPARAAIPGYDALAPAARAAVAAEAGLPPSVRASLRDLPGRVDQLVRDGALTPPGLRDEVLPAAQQARRFVEQVWPVLRELAGESRADGFTGAAAGSSSSSSSKGSDSSSSGDGSSSASSGGSTSASETSPSAGGSGGSRVDEAAQSVGDSGAGTGGKNSDGTRDFYPSPEEIAGAVERLYPVGETLLVRFRNDSLDDTPRLAELLTRNARAAFSMVELDGSHLTPLAQDAPDVAAAAAVAAAGVAGPIAEGLGIAAGGVLGEVAGALGLRQLEALETCIDEWVDSAITNGKV